VAAGGGKKRGPFTRKNALKHLPTAMGEEIKPPNNSQKKKQAGPRQKGTDMSLIRKKNTCCGEIRKRWGNKQYWGGGKEKKKSISTQNTGNRRVSGKGATPVDKEKRY